jgi:regulatory protein
MHITALEGRPRAKNIRVHLDDGTQIAVGPEVCRTFALRVGDQINDTQLAAMRDAEARRECLELALRLLSYRQRSEAELRDRLVRKRVPDNIVDDTIQRLRDAGLLDDAQFAQRWVDDRDQRAPRSRRLIAQELRAKGIAKETISGATAAVDEIDAAYRAAERRALSVASVSYSDFRRRIGDFLLRRGFDYEVVNRTVARLWAERGSSSEEEAAADA